MKASKYVALFLAVILVFSILLTGCQQGSPGSEAASGNTASGGPDSGSVSAPASTQAADDFGSKDPASYKAKLQFMAHSKQLEAVVNRFTEKYPGIEVEWILIPGSEHLQQIMTRVNSGNLPDVFTFKTEFARYITNAPNCYANLSEAPYKGEEVAKNLVPYTVDLSRDKDGKLRGLTWQATVGGIYYRRSIAKQYFGSDDPAEISKLFSSWDNYFNAARKLKDQSGGKVSMLAEYKRLRLILAMERQTGWVGSDGKLFYDENYIKKYFDYAKLMYDEGLLAKTTSDAEYMGTMQNGNVFSYIAPTWGLNFQIMPNAPDTAGDWGLALPPTAYFSGGTFVGISYKTAHPEESWLLFNYIVNDEDSLYQYGLDDGDYVTNLNVQQKIGALSADQTKDVKSIQFMGGQNIYAFYNELLKNPIRAELVTAYDSVIDTQLELACTSYVENGKTYDQALKQFLDEVYNAAPELK